MIASSKGYMIWESFSKLDASIGGSRMVRLPAWLPDPMFITAASSLCQREKFPVGTDAVLVCLIDPRGRYTKSTKYPGGGVELGSIHELHFNDPCANEELARLVINDLGDRLRREVRWRHDPPLRYSRSEGDLIMLDIPGIGNAPVAPEIWFTLNLTYVDPSCYGVQPPRKAFSIGTWQHQSVGAGRSVSSSVNAEDQSVFGFLFTAPSDGELSSLKFRVRHVRAPGWVSFSLYDVARSSRIGSPSTPWLVNYPGDHEPSWEIGCGAKVQAGQNYWLVGTSEGNALNVDIDTCVNHPAFASSRAGSAAGLVDNLPGHEDWRVLLTAITTEG